MVPLMQVLDEPDTSSLPCCLFLLLPCSLCPPSLYGCLSVRFPAANRRSEVACGKANLKTTRKNEGRRWNF